MRLTVNVCGRGQLKSEPRREGDQAAWAALDLGLVDVVAVSLVPVLFGRGKTYFGELKRGHVMLEDPEVVHGRRALHLRFRVRR